MIPRNVTYKINEANNRLVELAFRESSSGHVYITANGIDIAYLSCDGQLGPVDLNPVKIDEVKRLGFKVVDGQLEIHPSCKQRKNCW
ncbi:hypothetical protein C4565_00475 [Candidatus Parcubacteria bacterium]|nr:MAG: hypothetical protein C4565_00475 [Candidatus Parcubacteria bacterium]